MSRISRCTVPWMVLSAGLMLVACDDGGGGGETEADTAVQADTSPEPDTNIEPDTSPEPDSAVEVEVPIEPGEPAYPEAPYGTGYLDIIADLDFYDPWSGKTYKLSDYYQSEEKKVILIASAAGWCTACQYEAWDLVEVYEKYRDLGLEVLYTLYEDNRGKPFLQEGAPWEEHDRDLTYLQLWKENLGVNLGLDKREANYPFLVDREFILEEYYNQGATPLSLIVRTRDMRIMYRQVGYSAGSIEHIVKTEIYKP